MASLNSLDLSGIIKPVEIETTVVRAYDKPLGRDLAVGFVGLNSIEVALLVAYAIKLEQRRGGVPVNIEIEPVPGGRFDGLDLEP